MSLHNGFAHLDAVALPQGDGCRHSLAVAQRSVGGAEVFQDDFLVASINARMKLGNKSVVKADQAALRATDCDFVGQFVDGALVFGGLDNF